MKNTLIGLFIASLFTLGFFLTKPDSGSNVKDGMKTEMSSAEHEDHMQIASEKQFLEEMIPHHQEAVDVSRVIAELTQNEEVRALATSIVEGQEDEITRMKTWLKDLYGLDFSTETSTYEPMMSDPQTAEDSKRDETYLREMIAHHRSATIMAQQSLDVIKNEAVKQFAQQITIAQNQEIDVMQNILKGALTQPVTQQ